VSDRPSSNQPRSRRAAKRLRYRRNRLARRLLDEAYAEYRGLTSCNDNDDNNQQHSSIIVPSAPPPPSTNSSNQPPSPPCSPTPPVIEPDSPHSALTQRIFPDSPPPSICSFFPPSYSPISSPEEPPRRVSPTNSTTSSMEFIEEIHIPPPHPRYYYYYDPHQPLDTLIHQFPQPLPFPLILISLVLTVSICQKSGPSPRVRMPTQLSPFFFPLPSFLTMFLSDSFSTSSPLLQSS